MADHDTAAAPSITVARLFDSADPITGPIFTPDHRRITDQDQRARTLAYLRAGTPLLSTTGTMVDVVAPERGSVVPMSFLTDGTWIWSAAVSYYLDEYELAPDPELLEHIELLEAPPAELDADTLDRAMSALRTPPDTKPMWSPSRSW